MNNPVEVASHPVDERARRAGRALRSSASQRPLPELRVRRDRRGVGPVIAVACVVVLLVGLVGIARRQDHDTATNDNADLQWVIGEVPDGFEPSEVAVPGAAGNGPLDSTVYAVFGTDLAPDGPQFSVTVPNPQFFSQPLDAAAVNFVEQDEGGQRLVFADLAPPVASQQTETDVRLMFVEIDGRWTQTTSRGVTDADLSRVAAAMTLDIVDTPNIAVEALPDGIRLLDAGPIARIAPTFFVNAGGSTPTGTASITYRVSGAFEFVQLTVGRTTAADTTTASLAYNGFNETSLDGQPAWLIDGNDGATWSTLIWQRDDLTFYLAQPFATEAELAAAAGTVRPASQSEWNELVRTTPGRQEDPGRQEEETATTGPVDDRGAESADTTADNEPSSRPDPSTTNPATQTPVTDIPLTVDTDNATASDVRLSASLPDGYSYAIDVSVLEDGIRLTPFIEDQQLGTYINPRPLDDTSTFTPVIASSNDGRPGTVGIIATTEDPAATQLRVTRTTGQRYIADLHAVANQPDVKFTAILLPPGELVSADLVDADGNVLTTWTS